MKMETEMLKLFKTCLIFFTNKDYIRIYSSDFKKIICSKRLTDTSGKNIQMYK